MSRTLLLVTLLLTACGPATPGETWADESSSGGSSESGHPQDMGGDDGGDPCLQDPLQFELCTPLEPLSCGGGHCVMYAGPSVEWVCEMEELALPSGAACDRHSQCAIGICVPAEYALNPAPDATYGACGASCSDGCDVPEAACFDLGSTDTKVGICLVGF